MEAEASQQNSELPEVVSGGFVARTSDEAVIYELLCQDLDLTDLEVRLAKLPQIEEQVDHIFSGGVYIRQLHVPDGSLIIGKRHRFETCNILMSGTMLLYSGEGRAPVAITGPYQFTSAPNVKKMAYCVGDCVFMNIHPTDKTDLGEIERDFIITEDEFLELDGGCLCLG